MNTIIAFVNPRRPGRFIGAVRINGRTHRVGSKFRSSAAAEYAAGAFLRLKQRNAAEGRCEFASDKLDRLLQAVEKSPAEGTVRPC
jgi:hypothetical protein